MSIKISQIVKLMEACARTGVSEMSLQDEDSRVELRRSGDYYEVKREEKREKRDAGPLQQELPLQVDEAFEEVEQMLDLKEEFDLLPLTDPFQYEEILAMDGQEFGEENGAGDSGRVLGEGI